MENNLFYIAYKAPTIKNAKVIEPASLVRFEQVIEGAVIAKAIQRYARPNKQFKGASLSLDSFNGKQGFTNDLYTESDIIELLRRLTSESYTTRRMTPHNTNGLADSVFKSMYNYTMQLQINKHGMKLPS